MKSDWKTIAALAVSFAVGGIATLAAQAEGKAPAYFIAESEVSDPVADAKIIAKLPATAERFGGRYLARGGKIVGFSDNTPRRVVIVQFDSMDAAVAWRAAPDVKALEEERMKIGTKLRLYAVEGIAR